MIQRNICVYWKGIESRCCEMGFWISKILKPNLECPCFGKGTCKMYRKSTEGEIRDREARIRNNYL